MSPWKSRYYNLDITRFYVRWEGELGFINMLGRIYCMATMLLNTVTKHCVGTLVVHLGFREITPVTNNEKREKNFEL